MFAIVTMVLVHGIGQEQAKADELEAVWRPHLERGLRGAGFGQLADQLMVGDRITVRMAFYGDCFVKPGQMGLDPGELGPEARLLAEQFALAWLERAAADASDPRERRAASRELDYVHRTLGEEQGARSAARMSIASLARLRYFAPFSMAMAQRFVWRALTQVTRYFTEEHIRQTVLERVAQLVGPETKVLVGHSLGSVVAYEAAHQLVWPLPLLVTLGSPLGLRTIVYDRLRPQPPGFPPALIRWVNIADRDDFIAAAPNLTGLFGTSAHPNAVFEGGWTVDNGAKPHEASFYLARPETGRPLGQTLIEQS